MVIVEQKQQIYTIYANCQTSLVQAHLNLSEEFRQKYKYEALPRNYVAIQQELEIPEDVLSQTKLLIYQPTDNKYGSQSSDFIRNKVPSDCICISFPYVYFKGYWPENTKNPVNKKNKQYPVGKFPYGDSNIIEMIAKGYDEAKIIEELERENFYHRDYVLQNIRQTLLELIKRETKTDLKIAEFIRKNCLNTRLFHAPNHPTNIIGLNLANQILVKLGIIPISSIYHQEKFADYQLPIYPSISKILNLKFAEKINKYTVTFSSEKLNFQSYMKAYLKQYSQTKEPESKQIFTKEIQKFHETKKAENTVKYSFDKLPPEIAVQGNFDEDCRVTISEDAIEALLQGRLKLSIHQRGNKPIINNFQLEVGSSHGKIQVFVSNDNAEVKFGENSSGTYDLRLWRRSKVVIGRNTTANGITIICAQSDFITGSDCMFSNGILIQSADQHGLVDLKTGGIFNNRHRKVTIGDHVWLGRHSTLMPDVNVGKGSVIGTGAIVTSNVPEKVIAVGVPARVVRTDVTWSRSPNNLDAMSQEYVKSFSL